MTDNFRIIKEFIQSQFNGEFDHNEDSFYIVEIIGRRKDGASIESHKFKTYYIKKLEDLDKYENEIKLLCDILNMRAYISINHKSMKHVTLNVLAEYANRIAQDNFTKPYSVFDSCAAKYAERADQLWIIDVDKEECEKFKCGRDDLISYYRYIIENECEPRRKVVEIVPTKSGGHIITHPFNTVEFANKACRCKTVEGLIKKNDLTLIYENIQ